MEGKLVTDTEQNKDKSPKDAVTNSQENKTEPSSDLTSNSAPTKADPSTSGLPDFLKESSTPINLKETPNESKTEPSPTILPNPDKKEEKATENLVAVPEQNKDKTLEDKNLVANDDSKNPYVQEPPKFSLDDLPEPPQLDSEDFTDEKNNAPIDKAMQDTALPLPLVGDKKELAAVKKQDDKVHKDGLKIEDVPMPSKPKPKKGFLSNIFKKKVAKSDKKANPVKKEGFFSKMFKKKKISSSSTKALTEEKIDLAPLRDDAFAPPDLNDPISNLDPTMDKLDKKIDLNVLAEPKKENKLEPTTDKLDKKLELNDLEEPKKEEKLEPGANDEIPPDWLIEGEHYAESTPLTEVKGIGPAKEKLLKDAGIETAEHLIKHDHKEITKKTKIRKKHAKKILAAANKITNQPAKSGISQIIHELEQEKKAIEELQNSRIKDDNIIELEGHKDLMEILKKLESKRIILQKQEKELRDKEEKLSQHHEVYRKDVNYVSI